MELTAKKRIRTGQKVKTLRKMGLIPAVIYAPKKESINVEVGNIDFIKVYRSSGETEIVDLKISDDNQEYPVLIDSVSRHPVTDEIIHINFRLVDLTKPIRVNVPIHYTDQAEHPLIKNATAILIVQLDEIEVEVLPRNLPREFNVSVSNLAEIGDVLTLKDLKKVVDLSKIEILEDDEEIVIASLDYATQPELEVEETASEEELIAKVETTEERTEEEEAGSNPKAEKTPADK
jgi:large subunit ribosomal protein L25